MVPFDKPHTISLGVNKHLQGKTLKLAYYRNYCTDSNQILYSDKD